MVLNPHTLQRAIDNDELVLFYQPKVSLLSGHIIGAEALVRWTGENQQVLAPQEFLPLVTEQGLLHDLTIKLLDQVVDACGSIRSVRKGLAVSMNVAPSDLESHSISQRIDHHLDRGAIESADLQIEITEADAMEDFEHVQEGLERLGEQGIHLLMDDFGTGYSSIDRLSQLPFDALKLDKGVVQRMGTSPQNLNVVKSAISMARELRMTSVAEGVENSGVYDFLIANGCEEAQGYYIGHPMALVDYLDFVRQPHDYAGSQIGRIHQAMYSLVYYRKCLLDAAYCFKMSGTDALPSVMEPDISHTAEESRFGTWYFGVGTRLSHLPDYMAMREPLYDLHRCGTQFLDAVNRGADAQTLEGIIVQVDKLANRLIQLLHSLEREQLLAEPTVH